jgi:hypothetical protein
MTGTDRAASIAEWALLVLHAEVLLSGHRGGRAERRFTAG